MREETGCRGFFKYRTRKWLWIKCPKIDLHVHLDCSMSYAVAHRLRPDIGFERYRHTFVAPLKCTDLRDYLTRAREGIALMQTAEALRLVTLDLFEQLRADYVRYAEIRFAPLEHLRGGLALPPLQP